LTTALTSSGDASGLTDPRSGDEQQGITVKNIRTYFILPLQSLLDLAFVLLFHCLVTLDSLFKFRLDQRSLKKEMVRGKDKKLKLVKSPLFFVTSYLLPTDLTVTP
jgi:hypothetical protein